MPLPCFVQRLALYYVQKAYERLLRGFGNPVGGEDRLVWLEGVTSLGRIPGVDSERGSPDTPLC